MKSKYIPPIIMLSAGLVMSIVCRLQYYGLKKSLWIVVLTMLVFFILGSIYGAKIRGYELEADEREKAEEEEKKAREKAEEDAAVSDEGEVIEKDVDLQE